MAALLLLNELEALNEVTAILENKALIYAVLFAGFVLQLLFYKNRIFHGRSIIPRRN